MSINPNNGVDSSFDKFQLEEYKNISSAHFETNKQIAIFFRYFLLIVSAPAVIFVWFGNQAQFFDKLLSGSPEIGVNNILFIGFLLISVAIIGAFTFFYLINFRLDSILYARSVNGVRRYFYDKYTQGLKSDFRVLPIQTNLPANIQKTVFSMIVWAFGMVNAVYFAIGCRVIAGVGDVFFENYLGIDWILIRDFNFYAVLIVFSIVFLMHLFYHKWVCTYRDFSYMKNVTIGVDIDGVLNKHRDTFCVFLHRKCDVTLWADDIYRIPVHLMKEKGITREHEYKVFNEPSYWEELEPIQENIGKIIKELRNTFGYKIRIFSRRPWPDYAYIQDPQRPSYELKWKGTNIRRLTKRWLRKYAIKYNSLRIEKGSIDTTSARIGFLRMRPKSVFRNRFYYSKLKSYRYFVEDDFENAINLSKYCEYVFLIDHPYNKEEDLGPLPKNIIRVKSWDEIKMHIRSLG